MERIVIIAAALAATISTAASDELVVKVGKLDATYDTTAVPVEVQNSARVIYSPMMSARLALPTNACE